MANLTPEQLEVAQLIIDAINLEDIEADEIDPNDAIFNNGLGLDSIDALEISLEINKKYGVKIGSGDENVNQIFSSVASLASYIHSHK